MHPVAPLRLVGTNPDPQATQAADEFAPLMGFCFPDGHARQPYVPLTSYMYVPARQPMQLPLLYMVHFGHG